MQNPIQENQMIFSNQRIIIAKVQTFRKLKFNNLNKWLSYKSLAEFLIQTNKNK